METIPSTPDDNSGRNEKLEQELSEILNSNHIDSVSTAAPEQPHFDAKIIELSEKLSPASIERRVSKALEACDFKPNPELRNGLKDYYTEHYSLATLADSVLSTDPTQMDDIQKATYKNFINSLQIENTNPDDLLGRMDDLLKNGRFISDREVSGPLLLKVRAARLDNPEDKSLLRTELQLTAAVTSRLFSEVGAPLPSAMMRGL